nr:hypothetical protein [Mesorhizobium camelthorni]
MAFFSLCQTSWAGEISSVYTDLDAERDGYAVGLVVATGNPKANETARKIADEPARNFACGADERVLVSGDVPLPEFSRADQ